MIEVPAPQPAVRAKALSATVKQRNEISISPIQRVPDMMMQRYHIPGQTTAPRD
jgi:hypothetical protein